MEDEDLEPYRSVGRGGPHQVALGRRAILLVRLGSHWPVHAGSGCCLRRSLIRSRDPGSSVPFFQKSEHFAPQMPGQKHGWGMAACGLGGCVGSAHTFGQLVSASVSFCQARTFQQPLTPTFSLLEKVPFLIFLRKLRQTHNCLVPQKPSPCACEQPKWDAACLCRARHHRRLDPLSRGGFQTFLRGASLAPAL
jgi:hypothetical protein